ncbi:acetyl-CoA synthetase-like protein [Wolfiporia cocos MD-104 SS10]|uniref:Acetyl-CoA synthetase-like protein n=1 Tax=Wolfiporia cocos (strain MD-104) TaxID=742152 RepID=A0A2H3IVC3_WOLCO|nr:acetyl-CoA synthetase-like protein [Wolfiporia cocos MD-104 SS10]
MTFCDRLPYPPLDGSIPALPGFLDFHAEHNTHRPMWVYPSADSTVSGNGIVTWKEFADATHRIAHAIRPQGPGPDRAVVAIVVSCDTLLYHALTVGTVRAGLVPFPMSPRNSAPAVASMIERTDCHRLICQPSFSSLTDEIHAALPKGYVLEVDDLPLLSDIFPSFAPPSAPVRTISQAPYPPAPTVPPSDVVLYLHSSGSTGFPKPIAQTTITILHWCQGSVVTETRDHGLRWASAALPPFHTMGIIMQLYTALVSGQPVTLFAPRGHLGLHPPVPTPENTLEAAKRTNANAIPAVPAFLEAWAHNDADVKFLASADTVIYAGGPLSLANGTKLVEAGVYLCSVYGGTEFGAHSATFDTEPGTLNNPAGKTRQDWQWMQFTDQVNTRWVPQGDGAFELVFLTCPTHQPSKENLDEEKGYATSDLWEPHPTKQGLWRIIGRTDDVIILSNGEKIVPIQQEGHIGAHPWISGALMFGRGREQPGILLEPQPAHVVTPGDEKALVEFRNAIWHQVEEANRPAPAFARIFKEMIIVTDPSRPFPRAAKGTIMRKQAVALYEADISALYDTIADSRDAHGISPPASWTTIDVQKWLVEHATAIHSGAPISASDDLFAQGYNSLSATFLRNRIIGALRGSSEPRAVDAALRVQPNFIFTHPTLVEMAAAIVRYVSSGPDDDDTVGSPVADIEALIKKYTAQLPSAPAAPIQWSGEQGSVVLITGTTGALGSLILAKLLVNSRVQHVFALNRGSALFDRQRTAFETARLPLELLTESKLTLLSGNLEKADFGLDSATLDKISYSVTHIVHIAWRVDFNLALASFESHISAAVRLASLAPSAYFFFTSSIAAVQRWNVTQQGPVPEAAIGDPKVALGSGYGMAKYVVEEVLARAHANGYKATILRVGQLCGSRETGVWNTTEWFPILVKSSIALRCIPDLDGVVSWVPIDAAADAVVDTVLGTQHLAAANVVHPHPVTSQEILSAISAETGPGLARVSVGSWVEKLEKVAQSPDNLDAVPALKLLDFFRNLAQANPSGTEMGGLPLFKTDNAQSASTTLRGLRPLERGDVSAWVRYWRSKQFIPGIPE